MLCVEDRNGRTRNLFTYFGPQPLSQFTRLTDGHRDGQTDGRTDGQISIARARSNRVRCALKMLLLAQFRRARIAVCDMFSRCTPPGINTSLQGVWMTDDINCQQLIPMHVQCVCDDDFAHRFYTIMFWCFTLYIRRHFLPCRSHTCNYHPSSSYDEWSSVSTSSLRVRLQSARKLIKVY